MKNLMLNKEEMKLAETMTLSTMDNGRYNVTNELEHKIAEQMVASGVAQVSKKKNYGRIAQIKGV